MASPRKESLKCHACCDVNTKMPVILSLKWKETDELNLKKKKCGFPKAMLLPHNNDTLQSRNKDKPGKHRDIMTRHGAS